MCPTGKIKLDGTERSYHLTRRSITLEKTPLMPYLIIDKS